MKKPFQNSAKVPAERGRAKKLSSDFSRLALERFSNDLWQLQAKTRKKKLKKDHISKGKGLKKIQASIQQIKNYLIREIPAQPSSVYQPIYYYPPLPQNFPSKNEIYLPQLNARNHAENSSKNLSENSTTYRSYNVSKFASARLSLVDGEKPKKSRLGNRFKICAISVYFCLIFPKFSKKFQEIRYQWFKDRYKSPFCLKHLAKSLSRRLQEIDFGHIYEKSKTKSYELDKYPMITFTKLVMTEISSTLTNKLTLKYHHQLLGVGALNKHFYLKYQNSYMYYPEQVPFLQATQRKLGRDQLFLSQQGEILLIFIRTMFKVVIFDYLWGICETAQESGEKQKAYMIKVCTIFLHSVCVHIYKVGLDSIKTQTQQSQPKILQNKTIQNLENQLTKTTINLLTTNSIFCSKPHLSLRPKQVNSTKQPFSFIESISDYKQICKQINHSTILNDFRQQVTDDIIEMVISIREYLYEEERNVYHYIWGLAAEEKGLLRNSNGIQEVSQTIQLKGIHRRYRSQNDEEAQQQSRHPPKGILKQSTCRKISNISSYYNSQNKVWRSQASKVPSILQSHRTIESEYERTGGELKCIK